MGNLISLFGICILVTIGGCGDNLTETEELPFEGVLFINEFMASNDSTLADESGDYDDWIELHNAGETDVNLSGIYLTDDFSNLTRWKIPDTTITAGGFLLFWADNEETEGPLHTNFKLSASAGEEIGLFDFDADVQVIVLIDSISFGPQPTDTSYGRYPDGGSDWQSFSTPTPGNANVGD